MTIDRNAQVTGAGLRFVAVYLRDSADGSIFVPVAQPTTTGWPGLPVSGSQAVTLNLPDVQRLPATGEDSVYHTFIMPPTEGASGTLRVSKTDLHVVAMLAGLAKFGSVPWAELMHVTDRQGLEPDIIIHYQQRAINADRGSTYYGQTIWINYFLLNSVATPKGGNAEMGQVATLEYQLVLNQATVTIFGKTMTNAIHGCLSSSVHQINTIGRLRIEAFVGDGVETVFTLATAETMRTSGDNEVWVDGVRDFGAVVDTTAKTVTFDPAPSDGAKIIVGYELA